MTDVRGLPASTGRRTAIHGLTPAAIRALELHEAWAQVRASRRVVDLDDAILLHDPDERDPFLNRLSGLRLPDSPDAFDHRLVELLALFASLGRRPHVWLSPAAGTPADLAERLAAAGFEEVGGTYAMVQVQRPSAPANPPGADVRIQRLLGAGRRRAGVVRDAARVLFEAFGADAGTEGMIAEDLDRSVAPHADLCLLSVAGEPVAAGRRYTADGATYISSVGTRPGFQGRGHGTAVTAALIDDGRAAGGALVHLGVKWDDGRAQRVYRRLGFEIVGDRIADLLLR